jgi:hypothetical protein
VIRFLDGPAAGVCLALKRAPLYLRVVHDRRKPVHGWDALDQLDDTPAEREQVTAYKRTGPASWVHMKGCRAVTGFWPMAGYRVCDPQPPAETLRDTEAWQAWATAEWVKDKAAKTLGVI